MGNSAFIYDAIRTPRSKGKRDGTLHEVKPIDLGAGLLRELKNRHDLDTSYVDDVIMGCVSPIGEQGADIAKMVAQRAGWDESVAGVQLNRFCASGLEAVNTAAQKVISGWDQLIVAGGVESMSRVPMGSDGGAMMSDPEFATQESFVPQGIGADTIATIDGYTREDVDAYAMESQKRATHARDNGYFDKSVVPVLDKNGLTILDRDDFIKPDTSMEILAGLNPSFEMMGNMAFDDIILSKYNKLEKISHVHTPGNSSGIVDGASAVLIGSQKAGQDLNLKARGRIIAGAILASDPVIMLTGPGPSAKKCLKTAGLKTTDVDLWEINEAFASVAMAWQKEMEYPMDQININGGAIALGHPLGATGARLMTTLIHNMKRSSIKYGLQTMCEGGGQANVTILENCS